MKITSLPLGQHEDRFDRVHSARAVSQKSTGTNPATSQR